MSNFNWPEINYLDLNKNKETKQVYLEQSLNTGALSTTTNYSTVSVLSFDDPVYVNDIFVTGRVAVPAPNQTDKTMSDDEYSVKMIFRYNGISYPPFYVDPNRNKDFYLVDPVDEVQIFINFRRDDIPTNKQNIYVVGVTYLIDIDSVFTVTKFNPSLR